jgi:heme-degrading monooxygenase HmoA
MFVAMNRFLTVPGRGGDFEHAWKTRESYLYAVPGFVRFALLRGDEEGEYVSHTTWQSRDAFEAWLQSDAFRAAHGRTAVAGMLLGPPSVSLYDAVIELERARG